MRRAVLVLAVALAWALPATAASPPAYRLASLQASLFFNDTGDFSKPIPEDAPLFNTVIGEGWAGQASNATLVRVRVTGQPGSYVPRRFVRLTVVRGAATPSHGYRWGRTVLDRRVPIPVLTRAGTTVVAFWIADTGCAPLRLTARLGGQAASAPLVRVLPFACGE